MVQTIFYAILAILVADFLFERILSVLNIINSKKELPLLLQTIYAKDEYSRQQAYFRENSRFSLFASSFSCLLAMLMYGFGGFAWLDGIVAAYFQHPISQSLVFFALLYLVSDFLQTPFDYYAIFSIEERYGFNKISQKLFFFDKLKSCLLTLLVGGAVLSLIVWVYTLTPSYFCLLAFVIVAFFTLFMTLFYSNLIVPLFNKQSPLADGELRSAIECFSEQTGFKLDNIFLIDGSKRSTKANAYFTGFGAKKRIVLYDTLMDTLTTEEIVAVLAHEIGHYKHKHTLINLFIALPSMLLLFLLLGYVLQSDAFAQALGGTAASFHLNALAFVILYSPLSLFLGLFQTILSRRFEYQADDFAASCGYAQPLISALKKLSSSSLSNLMPHPLYVFFHYSHPTLYQRVVELEKK